MSKEEAKPEGEAAAGKKKLPMKFIIMGVILLVFLGIEAGMATFFVKKLKPEDPEKKELEKVHEEQEKEKEEKRKHTEMGVTLEKPIEVTVNIAGTNGERFLKSSIQLEWSAEEPELTEEVNARVPKIKDIIIEILSSKTMEELQAPEGKKALRDAIVADVNAILPPEIVNEETHETKPLGKVERALFAEYIIQ